MSRQHHAPVSVIIPTWRRLDCLQKTIQELEECSPAPAEILVHVDAGDDQTAPWLHKHASQVRVLESEERMGPGGGRNRLLDESSQPYIASFDDDSYPLDADYFTQVIKTFEENPEAGVLSATVTSRGEAIPESRDETVQTASFVGAGCAYRRDAWKDTAGYLPLPLAYGMEEVDLSLQLIDEGWSILRDRRLRVFHDTDLSHHTDPDTVAATIANRALLGYLRYPIAGWGLALAQFVNRIWWSIRAGRTEGIWKGICHTPAHLWRYRHLRDPVSWATLLQVQKLKN